jgi:dihydrolipoamide dehydrogenase
MTTHVAIVGAYGSAGVAVAQELAGAPEVELTLVDDGDPGGGLCILRGCMPSKEVLSAAEHRFAARHDHRLDGPLPEVDLESVVATKDDHTANFAAHRRAAVDRLADQDGVTFHHETARFVDDRTLEVGGETLAPDYVVVATGSSVSLPDLPGIDDVPVTTSADVLDATEFGDTGAVMGFGYVGLELVPYLREAAGMQLTVIEHDPRPLDEADPRFGDALLDYYRDAFGVDVRTETTEQRVELTDDGGVRLHVDRDGTHETVRADQLFAFTGRRPTLDRLGLEATALSPDDEWVAATMQARDDERVFVVGDVNGREPILHVAKEQGAVAAENVLRHRDGRSLRRYENVHHHVIFSGLGVLPFARVGHSATSAAEADLDHLVVTREAADDGVFATKNVPEGLARLVVGTDGTVLGYQGLHYHADVMAKTMQLAVELGLDVRAVPDRAYHPTTPEILDGLVRAASRELDGSPAETGDEAGERDDREGGQD